MTALEATVITVFAFLTLSFTAVFYAAIDDCYPTWGEAYWWAIKFFCKYVLFPALAVYLIYRGYALFLPTGVSND